VSIDGRRRITWLGHATVLIETHGVRLITDPVLRGRVAHLRRHAPLQPAPAELDAVLISHVHHDHLDRPSLRALATPATTALIPHGAVPLLRGADFGAVREVRAGETVSVAGLDVRAVPAWHDGRRLPGTAELDTLGFVADRVWFAGDTDLHPQMSELRGAVDVALLPIWGWGTSLGPGHMDPAAAAEAVAIVQPEVVVPIHWGTFLPLGAARRHLHLLREPAVRFAERAAETAPGVRVSTLEVGDSVEL
jgi:L-ascorbate metabolism protein UlaG (beta-lactamase superfamily)